MEQPEEESGHIKSRSEGCRAEKRLSLLKLHNGLRGLSPVGECTEAPAGSWAGSTLLSRNVTVCTCPGTAHGGRGKLDGKDKLGDQFPGSASCGKGFVSGMVLGVTVTCGKGQLSRTLQESREQLSKAHIHIVATWQEKGAEQNSRGQLGH